MGLRELRKGLGLTQVAMAGSFGLTRNTYVNYERRVTDPPLSKCSEMAVFFNCTIGELFDLEEGGRRPEGTSEETLLANYGALSEIGQEKLVDYSIDLVASGNYTLPTD